jgi:hypothetical protein
LIGKGNHGMFLRPRLASRECRLLAAFVLLLVAGCSGSKSADQALDKSLAAAGLQRTSVCPLAGKLTVDGLPPTVEQGEKIIVMLNDPAKPDAPPNSGAYATVGQDGEFSFRTYAAADGVNPGTYIVTFAKLKVKKKKGLVGPDGFQNLYNDAGRNQKENPDFKINHQAPGKTDYAFDLKIAGREAAAAGPKALTQIVIRGK